MRIGSEKLETVELGRGEWPFLEHRDDGLTESSYYVFEASGMFGGKTRRMVQPARLTLWQWLLTWLGAKRWVYVDHHGLPLFEPEEPRPPPRQPGQMWHGFCAAGGPISRIRLMGGGGLLWEVQHDPPVDATGLVRPWGLTWPAFLLGYHDLVLTFVHAPGSSVTVVERWTAPYESRQQFLAADGRADEFGTWRAPVSPDGHTAVVISSGMVALDKSREDPYEPPASISSASR